MERLRARMIDSSVPALFAVRIAGAAAPGVTDSGCPPEDAADQIDGKDQMMHIEATNPVEQLERRELLAATVTFSRGVLFIRGSDAADVINLRLWRGALTVDGNSEIILASRVRSIAIDGRGGDDRIFILNPLLDSRAEFLGKSAVMVGGAGNDTLAGGFGRDLLFGGIGDDSLVSAWGDDVVFGGLGNDSVNGGDGNDLIFGGFGADLLDGGPGNDIVYGEEDADALLGSEGNDLLIGGAGFDTLTGGAGNNTLADLPGGFTSVPTSGATDVTVGAPALRPGHKVFARFRGTVLSDVEALSQRLPSGKVGKAVRKIVGKTPYEGLFVHKRVARFFGVAG